MALSQSLQQQVAGLLAVLLRLRARVLLAARVPEDHLHLVWIHSFPPAMFFVLCCQQGYLAKLFDPHGICVVDLH